MNDDFLDLLHALVEADVEFLVVGAHALAVHGVPRSTGDLDVWVRPTEANAQRTVAALRAFGATIEAPQVSAKDFESADSVVQIGLPPRRVDLLTSISGVTFDEAWPDRVQQAVAGDLVVPFLGRKARSRTSLRPAGPRTSLTSSSSTVRKHRCCSIG